MLRQRSGDGRRAAALAPYLDADPDKTLAFVAEMNLGEPDRPTDRSATSARCIRRSSGEAGTLPDLRHGADGQGRPGSGHLRLPDASGDRQRKIRQLPDLWHEAAAGHDDRRRPGTTTGMNGAPWAPCDGEQGSHGDRRIMHGHDASAPRLIRSITGTTRCARRRPPRQDQTTPRRRDRVGRRHGGGQPHDHAGQHAMAPRRPRPDAENHAIDWTFRVGDRVKIRLVNEMDSDHPMHHPFHIHGAGRFLILSRDGVPEPNLVWKDTVLVRDRARPSTSCSTSPTRASGWPTATSPSTTRAA